MPFYIRKGNKVYSDYLEDDRGLHEFGTIVFDEITDKTKKLNIAVFTARKDAQDELNKLGGKAKGFVISNNLDYEVD